MQSFVVFQQTHHHSRHQPRLPTHHSHHNYQGAVQGQYRRRLSYQSLARQIHRVRHRRCHQMQRVGRHPA